MTTSPVFSRRHALQIATGAVAVGCALARPLLGMPEQESAWPCWRGVGRDGFCREAFPSDLSKLERTWNVTLGDSYSGPVVAKGKVFTTEAIGKEGEALLALDQATGKTLWKQTWPGAMSVPFFAKANGDWIRSTPAVSGNTIVVGGMRDVLAAFDTESGDERWRIDFVKDHGATLPSFGLVCSPLIEGNFVYVQAGGAVRKISLESGELVWANLPDDGGMYGGAFSSPVIAELHGTRQLLTQTRTTLAGVELETGEVLWSEEIPAFRGMNILTPTTWKNHVFTSSYGGRSRLLKIDVANHFWSVETAWESKTEAYMSSPLVIDDYLYLHLRNKRFACLDLTTGEETWRTTPFGDYWSTITDGRRILALDESGELLLVEANAKEFQLLDRRRISEEPSWAHVAKVGSQVFVRTQNGLDAYQWQA